MKESGTQVKKYAVPLYLEDQETWRSVPIARGELTEYADELELREHPKVL